MPSKNVKSLPYQSSGPDKMRRNCLVCAMANRNDRPSSTEITQQIERISNSKTFATRSVPTLLLKSIVKHDLNKEPIDEYQLGIEVFGKPKGWNPKQENVVRQQKVILRDLLKMYYVNEGKEDPVLIAIPKRQGSIASYDYNPHAHAFLLAWRAADLFEKAFPMVNPGSSGPVLRTLREALRLNNINPTAHAKLGEILLFYTLCDQTSGFSSKTCVPEAWEAAEICLGLDPDNWLGHVVKGAVHCCRFEWEKATMTFEKALALESEKTESHFFYICFLAAVGRMEEALMCSESRIHSTDENELIFGPRVLLQYVQRKFGTAYTQIVRPSMRDRKYHPVLFIVGKELAKCNYWTTYLLLACIEIGSQNPFLGLQYAGLGSAHSLVSSYMGLTPWASCLCGVRSGNDEPWWNATKFAVEAIMKQPDRFGPINLALVYMQFGKEREAVLELGKACEEHHPLMVWLHLWPIFDSLREREDFKALIQRMGLPAEATATVYASEFWFRRGIDSAAQSLAESGPEPCSDQSAE